MHGRKIIINNAPQGSDEWLAARVGMLTGTDAHALWVNPSKKDQAAGIEWADGAQTLAMKIIGERMTKKSSEGTLCKADDGEYFRKNIQTGAMTWGLDHEEDSRRMFNEKNGLNFESVGFASIEDMGVGCSVDGRDEEKNANLEMKHYETHNVLALLKDPASFWNAGSEGDFKPTKEAAQCIHNAYVWDAASIYLIARDPRLPAPLNETFVVVEKHVDELRLLVSVYADRVRRFMNYVQKTELKLLGLD